MKSLVQIALGEDWDKLPPALQAHYRHGDLTEIGHMTIEYPWFMQLYLDLMRLFGALVNRRGRDLATLVEKYHQIDGQSWKWTITYPTGKTVCFNSYLVRADGNQLIEFVNPFLGLQMAVSASDSMVHYSGVRFVLKLGTIHLPIPEWLLLGHTSIKESAIDESHFAMDFRLTHPILGEVFRYSGEFKVDDGEGKCLHPPCVE